jgi:hypothetical protein
MPLVEQARRCLGRAKAKPLVLRFGCVARVARSDFLPQQLLQLRDVRHDPSRQGSSDFLSVFIRYTAGRTASLAWRGVGSRVGSRDAGHHTSEAGALDL